MVFETLTLCPFGSTRGIHLMVRVADMTIALLTMIPLLSALGSLLTHEVATVSGANKTFNRVSNITFPGKYPCYTYITFSWWCSEFLLLI